MSSFSEFEKYRYFSRDIFFSEWTGSVLGERPENARGNSITRSEADRLRDRIKSLWMSFNEDRRELHRKYSDTKKFVNAYISSFYIPNIQRIYSVLNQRQNLKELIRCFDNSGAEFSVLDFGAGPLSASAALLITLDRAGADLGSKKIRIVTVERSSKMTEEGLKILRSSFPELPAFEHENLSSPLKAGNLFDIILCANVFNEIPEKYRLSNLNDLVSVLKGLILITEPGQDVHSRSLSSLRNDFLKNEPLKLKVISPCPHSLSCPLSAQSPRPDWCWFSTRWKVPEQVEIVDRITGLDHRQLNYSYLFAASDSVSGRRDHYVVVSDIIAPVKNHARTRFENWMRNNLIKGDPGCLNRVSDGEVSKILLCGPDGKLVSAVGGRKAFTGIGRGSELKNVPKDSCLCRERQVQNLKEYRR